MIEIKDVTITLPKKIVFNSSIEKKYNFKKNQIFDKTGIIKRFVSASNDTSEKYAIKSAKTLKKKTDLPWDSEELKLKILEDHPDCGGFMQPLSYYKDYYSLGIPAEDIWCLCY